MAVLLNFDKKEGSFVHLMLTQYLLHFVTVHYSDSFRRFGVFEPAITLKVLCTVMIT